MKFKSTIVFSLVGLALWMLPACQSGSGSAEASSEMAADAEASPSPNAASSSATVDPEDFQPGSFGEQLAAILQQPSPQGKILPLQQIKFQEGGVIFTEDTDLQELNELARIMKANPRLVVEVAVFAEKAPTDAINIERFAKSRAYFIKNHLINEGVIKVNIETKGFEANEYNTEPGQSKDRAEIRILGI